MAIDNSIDIQEFLRLLGDNQELCQSNLRILEQECKTSKDVGVKIIKPMIERGFESSNIKADCELLIRLAPNLTCNYKSLKYHYDKYLASQKKKINRGLAQANADIMKDYVFGSNEDERRNIIAARSVIVNPKRTILVDIVQRIAMTPLLEGVLEMKSKRWFKIEEKITFNNLEPVQDIIREHCECQGMLSKIYSTFDRDGRHIQYKVLDKMKCLYLRNLSRGITGVELFWKIVDDTKNAIETGKDADNLIMEDIELCVRIIVAHAFDHCKIFENPKEYVAPEWNEPEV